MAVDPNIKIVVVDDSGTMRMMFKQILNKTGFENLVMAVNGADGLEKVKNEKPDLVISDWNMPQMTGLELLKAVRADPNLSKMPILLVTAEAKKQQIVEAAQAGVNGYIVKPFTAATLKEKIEKIFERINK